MKTFKSSILLLVVTFFIQANSPKPDTYVATSPCDAIPRAWLSIPATADCEMIKWSLVLQHDPRNQAPTFYKLNYTYGMSKPSTKDFINDGTSGVKEGKWSIQNTARNRVVYRLTPTSPDTPISLLKLDNYLLHFLDQDGKLMIGHAGWSYTLNGI